MPITGLPWFERDLRVKALTDHTVAPTLKVSEPVKAIEPVGFTLDEWTLIDYPELAILRDEDDFLVSYADCED
jgi:hypothetical protein